MFLYYCVVGTYMYVIGEKHTAVITEMPYYFE